MITKFAIVCLSISASTMIGIARLKSKKKRVDCLASLVRLCNMLISEISFRKDNLFKLLSDFAESDRTELGEHIKRFCVSPYSSIEIKSKTLKSNEKQLVADFLRSLGMTDSETQILELRNYKKRFEEILECENEKYKKTANMELKLFILAGLAIGIILL